MARLGAQMAYGRAVPRALYSSWMRIHRLHKDARGQGTVEFAVVTSAFIAIVIAGGVAWRVFGGGILVEHALTAASHHVLSGFEVMADVFMF